ncbi:MAG TPA: hypothetical protein DCW90_12955 [Lachnospiraceae bacterium]|nr:hypothetical protein [Lachnospiraceae bacterium]
MLTLTVPASDSVRLWDEKNEVFYIKQAFKGGTVKLEHSLISISRWEEKWCKPFLSTDKTEEELNDYIHCMAINQQDDTIFNYLTQENYAQIAEYLERPMTATTFPKEKSGRKKIITSELVYYWMVELGIPFECEKWNIKRLLVLIRVTELERTPKKKVSRRELVNQYAELNAARRAKLHTKG